MDKLICDHKTVCSISLSGCRFTSEFANALLQSIKTTQTLTGLSLNDNTFTDCGEILIKILNAIDFSRIEDFEFSHKEDKDNKELEKSLCTLINHCKCLQTLSLRSCNLTIFKHISLGIAESSTLQSLNYHSISFQSVSQFQKESIHLSRSIKLIMASQSLKSLNLTGFYFDETIMSSLAAGLTTNKILQTLILDSNSLQLSFSWSFDEGLISQIWITLFEALKQNTTLHTLSIKHNEVGSEGFEALIDLLDENKSITSLSISRTTAEDNVSLEYLYELEEDYGGRLKVI